MTVTRREFLRTAFAGLGVLTAGRAFHRPPSGPAEKAAAARGSDESRRYLLLDSRNVSDMGNVVQSLGKVVKHPSNPLFVPD